MGHGDELYAMGQAETLWRRLGRRVLIVDSAGNPRWSDIWQGNPAIARPCDFGGKDLTTLVNCSGARPYIAGWGEWNDRPRAIFSGWKVRDHVGRFYFSLAELKQARERAAKVGRFVVIEPGLKDTASTNKAWGRERYQAVVDANPGVMFVQLGPTGTRYLGGVYGIETATYREAAAVLAHAAAYVGPEGGLHAAAGFQSVPAVVIFGGFIPPEVTGFPWHLNLYVDGPESPCGRWANCPHCAEAMAQIKPERVSASLQGILEKSEQMAARGVA